MLPSLEPVHCIGIRNRVIRPDHLEMGEQGGIVEILSALRAAVHTGVAFDTDAGHAARIIRIDRSHRADPGAESAADTFVRIRLWLGF